MNYTRRSVLRNAARISIGLAASSSLPLLSGCHHGWGPGHPATFSPGIRIFFIGAWIFCTDPLGDQLLAVTVDMASMKHTFPYGVWPGDEGINQNESLQANPSCGSPTQRNAYPVTISNFKSNYQCGGAVFSDACDNFRFNYFQNEGGKLSILFNTPGIRVVSFPFPTRMITANTFLNSNVTNRSGAHYFHVKGGATTSNVSDYVASAHIFEYENASTLTFNDAVMIEQGSKRYRSDFHFHTVPPKGTQQSHSQDMLRNLLSSISPLEPGKFDLNLPDQDASPSAGAYVPNCVDASELTLPRGSEDASKGTHIPFHADLASCAAPGLGINDPPPPSKS